MSLSKGGINLLKNFPDRTSGLSEKLEWGSVCTCGGGGGGG